MGSIIFCVLLLFNGVYPIQTVPDILRPGPEITVTIQHESTVRITFYVYVQM